MEMEGVLLVENSMGFVPYTSEAVGYFPQLPEFFGQVD